MTEATALSAVSVAHAPSAFAGSAAWRLGLAVAAVLAIWGAVEWALS